MTTATISLRTLLRAPPALRPFLIQQQQAASYHSYEHPAPPPYPEPANSILSSALQHVPQQGFTRDALVSGAKDNKYLDISAHNLFPKGPFDLVKYYLVTQRLALADRVQFPPPDASGRELGTGQKIKSLILSRLQANVDTGILPHLPQALGQMSLAENIPASLRELGLLADEMWFLAGDKSVDSSWYTKRGTLSAVYASTEVFQTRDQSTDHKDTAEFLGRRLQEVRVMGSLVGGTAEWVGFQAGAVVNLLRSKGVRV
ncbi:Putative ubiquinone biosynthesis protein COQ9 [Septoria linicola]|uniref:Ubiquinone biosynthesis protein n=1 Tax=Septoria linicola TaxID=215465 RepID=A0A9Q9EMS9_9PEZI|nr:Putative ubiquinone biosynthesis protein COQ9 [Septoria linicola]